ncbi:MULTISPECIES: YecH family metal-binding protein [unclassified Agarivorans]|uniref:YecH family metal-binding protein n=1 Tax=unclassified Agarivorans TaxID=2636026 RepID=UPI0026E3F8EC|nr:MULTISPECIES: YecH family metal-binding protein [unclassified Agarivorans]MDO6688004.1 YecH family protein [Agarivorans sp. 3_MG-2023]MDO6715271.1 YecH family protein [Agarivorans sp. 2_MG-2023]
MSESIHGHQVMQLMLEQGGSFTSASLEELMKTTFGADSKYHTCRQKEMNAQELIVFLAERGKFVEAKQGFTACESKICSHK